MMNKAQGTIEYLVIIAIVVVIGLVVVSMLIGLLDQGSSVSEKSSKLSNWTNTLAVTETSVNTDGNYLVRLANNSGEELTVTGVQVGDTSGSYSEDLFMSGAQNFVVDSSEECSAGDSVTKQVTITYVSKYGLEKTEVFPVDTFFNCEEYNVNASLLADQCLVATYSGDAVESEVMTGSTFYSGSSTLLTGSGTQTLSAANDTVSAGYYAETTLSAVDSNLTEANIVTGKTIFGVDGSATEQGATQYLSTSTPHLTAGYYDVNDLNSIDTDLNVDNIKSGANIFGVTGTYEGSGGGDPGIGFIEFSAQSYSSTDGGATVTDSANGLVWQASSYNSGSNLAWQTAMDYCNNNTAGLAGTGWRLPNMAEIGLLYNYSSWSMYGSSFSNNTDFWSSTTVPSDTSIAYNLDAYDGIFFDSKTSGSSGARCVRSE